VGEISLGGGASSFSGGSPGTGVDVDGGFRFEAKLTLNTYRFFGHEFGYAYSQSTYKVPDEVSVPIHSGTYNFLVYGTPEGSRIRPFGTGGIGFASFFPPGASVYYGNQITKFGFNYGGGIKARVSSIIGIRFDVRQYNLSHPFEFPGRSGRLLQTAYTGGVSLLF
jgi:hypothetical protein